MTPTIRHGFQRSHLLQYTVDDRCCKRFKRRARMLDYSATMRVIEFEIGSIQILAENVRDEVRRLDGRMGNRGREVDLVSLLG